MLFYFSHWFKSYSGDRTLYDKVCEWFVTVRWFSQGTPVSSTNKIKVITKLPNSEQSYWPSRYYWNIVENGVKHHTLSSHHFSHCHIYMYHAKRICVPFSLYMYTKIIGYITPFVRIAFHVDRYIMKHRQDVSKC